MATTTRLLDLLSLLQTRRDWSGTLLADRLGISHRTVRRDIERLRELGYSIHATMGPDGGYRLEAGSDLPPLLFDDAQAVALAVALRTAAISGVGIEEHALRALTTIRQVLPSRLRARLDALDVTAVPAPGQEPLVPVDPEVLLVVSAAVRAHEVLRFEYTRPHAREADDRPPRRVEPHELVFSAGRWYLVAWDLDLADWRIFRVDRVALRQPTRLRFAPRPLPGGSGRALVAARFKGSDTVDRWPCTGTVVLHLPIAEVAPFAGDGTVEPIDDERCRYSAGSWSWVGLAASLGRFDCRIDVVAPAELAEAFTVLADRSAEAARSIRTPPAPPG